MGPNTKESGAGVILIGLRVWGEETDVCAGADERIYVLNKYSAE